MTTYTRPSASAQTLMELAGRAAQSVADDLRSAFRAPMTIDFKSSAHDLVTVHDRAAEDRIRQVLGEGAPGSVVVGEEAGTATAGNDDGPAPAGSGATAGAGPGQGAALQVPAAQRVTWYVDPIDGTANFAGGVAYFCTSIAAAVDGRVVAAAINDPIRRMLFTATPDGAWCNGEPLSSQGAAAERDAMLLTDYPGVRAVTETPEPAGRLYGRMLTGYRTVRRLGSAALDLAHVAAGWADAAFGARLSPWDIAAGMLLIRSAGGVYGSWRYGGGIPAGGSGEAFADGSTDGSGAMVGVTELTAPGYLAHVRQLRPTLLREVAAEVFAAADTPTAATGPHPATGPNPPTGPRASDG